MRLEDVTPGAQITGIIGDATLGSLMSASYTATTSRAWSWPSGELPTI